MLEPLRSDKFQRYHPLADSGMVAQTHHHIEFDGHPRAQPTVPLRPRVLYGRSTRFTGGPTMGQRSVCQQQLVIGRGGRL